MRRVSELIPVSVAFLYKISTKFDYALQLSILSHLATTSATNVIFPLVNDLAIPEDLKDL